LTIFILHSLGSDFWQTIGTVDSGTKTVIALDIIISVAVGLVDFFGFSYAGSRLSLFKDPEAEEDKEEGEKKEKAEVKDGEMNLPDQEEEEKKPLTQKDYIIPGFQFVMYIVLVVILVVVSIKASLNSGTVISVLVHLVMLVIFIYLAYLVLKDNPEKVYVKSHVLGYRGYLMVHLTLVVAVFWVTFSILLLSQGEINDQQLQLSFFDAVLHLGGSGRTALCILQLISFFLTMFNYAYILYLHQRSLAVLEEMASLNIRERTGH